MERGVFILDKIMSRKMVLRGSSKGTMYYQPLLDCVFDCHVYSFQRFSISGRNENRGCIHGERALDACGIPYINIGDIDKTNDDFSSEFSFHFLFSFFLRLLFLSCVFPSLDCDILQSSVIVAPM